MKYLYRQILWIVLAILPFNVFSQAVNHWETIINTDDYCTYFIPQSDIGSSWITKNFDDSNWTTAQSGIGYGDGDDNTEIPKGTISVYIRYTFTIHDIAQIDSLILDVDYDDGFIAYLNGAEVARDNVGTPASWDMTLGALHEAELYSGGLPERFNITKYKDILLENGENVLAVEVHNERATSSDLSSNVFLHAGINVAETIYKATPDWFWRPVYIAPIEVTDSKLPLVLIQTNGQAIPDEPRIVADMGIVYNGEGQTNSQYDAWNEYSGKISIEIRGESSRVFDKKSFSIELQNPDGSNNNVSILGLPEENDFVLYGPYSDKTMIKNALTYTLYRKTGRWAPRTRFVELFLNDEYRGIYVLTEKLKRDEERVDIDKLTPDDISQQAISGGYILRRDKINKLDENEYWTSPVDQIYFQQMQYQYYDPEFEELTSDQADYIKNWMKEFDELMSGTNYNDPDNGYAGYIKVKSFIDMMFINEISKGIDCYLFSTYFFKENDEDGGQLVAGPPWDYNIAYGNIDYGNGHDIPETYGWLYDQGGRVYWWNRLMEDETFRNRLYCKWSKYRSTIYSDENINFLIDSCVSVIGMEAIHRNFEKFPTLGTYIWPNLWYPETYEEEIVNLKQWLMQRLEWMDTQWLPLANCPVVLTDDDAAFFPSSTTVSYTEFKGTPDGENTYWATATSFFNNFPAPDIGVTRDASIYKINEEQLFSGILAIPGSYIQVIETDVNDIVIGYQVFKITNEQIARYINEDDEFLSTISVEILGSELNITVETAPGRQVFRTGLLDELPATPIYNTDFQHVMPVYSYVAFTQTIDISNNHIIAFIEIEDGKVVAYRYYELQIESAINSRISSMDVIAYPNPSDFSNLVFNIQSDILLSNVAIEVYDISGRSVYKHKIMVEMRNNDIKIDDLSHLNRGLYIYKIFNSNSQVAVGKLIKN